jgi:hypothetical protein
MRVQPLITVEEMIALYRAGRSLADIGITAGIGVSSVSRLLREAGEVLRPRGWSGGSSPVKFDPRRSVKDEP